MLLIQVAKFDEYTDEILHWVAENQKNPKIVQIKICIAASSAFIFALGMKFSKTQNKETVIFHYERIHILGELMFIKGYQLL